MSKKITFTETLEAIIVLGKYSNGKIHQILTTRKSENLIIDVIQAIEGDVMAFVEPLEGLEIKDTNITSNQ